MIICVNGKEREVPQTLTVRQLLQWLDVHESTAAVAVNEEVVRKQEWDVVRVDEGSRVEIVRIVAGG